MEKTTGDDDQLQATGKKTDNGKKMNVPEKDAKYLLENHKLFTVPEMARVLKRANTTVYGFMEALGLEPKAREITPSHPFRRQNRKLETMLLGHRIQNAKLKRRL